MSWKTQFANGGANDRAVFNRFYETLVGGYKPHGNVYYVSSSTGSSSGPGWSPHNAYATINQAVAVCTADNDDCIVCLPGHTEALAAAGGVALSTAGVRLIGLGVGRQRPKFTYATSTAASFDVTAARVSVDNFTFVGTGIDALTAMVNVKTAAADCTIANCEIEHGNASGQATLALLTDATADRLKIDNCYFHGTTDAGTTAAISLVGGNEISITNCRIFGSYNATGGAIAGATTDSLNLFIAYNYIINRTASSTKVIVLTASSTGAIADNIFGILSGTAPVTAAALDVIGGNYYKASAGVAAGTLV